MDLNSTDQSGQKQATAVAHANIALIKYWGKRSISENLPAVGSISITLDALQTETSVHFDPKLESDVFKLNGQAAVGKVVERVSQFLDIACGLQRANAFVESKNNFATSAGLASSA